MNINDIKLLLEGIGAFIVVLGGFIGIIYAGIDTLIKTRTAEHVALAQQKLNAVKTLEETKDHDIALAEKLTAMQDKVVTSLEARFVKMENELATTRQDLAAAKADLTTLETLLSTTKDEVHEWKEKYTVIVGKRIKEHGIVLKMIEAIQAGFDARQNSPHSDNCAACLSQDRALVIKLQEVREILLKE